MTPRTLRIQGRGWDGFDRRAGRRRRFYRRFFSTVAILAVVVGIAAGSLWFTARNRALTAYDRFQAEMTASEYDAALQTYRDVQQRALHEPGYFTYTAEYQAAMSRMESDLTGRIRSIYDDLSGEKSLDAASRSLLDGMQEVSGMILARMARASCEAYLAGTGDIEETGRVLTLLVDVQGSHSAIQSLLDEIPALTAAQPTFLAADQAFQGKEWIDAATAYLGLVDSSTGFLRETAQARLDACRTTMRDVVFADVRTMMAGARYYTALDRLQVLGRIYPGDADVASLLAQCQAQTTTELEAWTGNIECIAVRPLIADTASAFDGDAYAKVAGDAMLTTYEFKRILQQLYDRGYVLVDLPSLFDFQTKDGQVVATHRTLQIPKGKKPLVFNIEGLNYYAARHMTGNSVSLSLDADGHVVSTYPSPTGMKTDGEGEAIGLLEAFLVEHPDFSFNGARGTISLTGYECVFGAVTDADQVDDRNAALQSNGEAPISLSADQIEANRQQVLQMIKVLTDHGWSFASSTYGGIDISQASLARITADTAKWTAQVESLTGPTNILVYPNGSWIKNNDARMPVLKAAGFRIFCGIGATPYLSIGKDSVFLDRVLLNGYSLVHTDLSRFFDASAVRDPARPK